MRFATFDGGRIGIVDGHDIVDISEFVDAQPGIWPPLGMVRFIADYERHRPHLSSWLREGARKPLSSVRIDTPVQWPSKLVATPANYHGHMEEMRRGPGLNAPFAADAFGFHLVSPSSLSGPADPIILPAIARDIIHECEIAIIIGKGGKDITRADAMNHVFGYACLVDVVIRGREEKVMRKSYDSFTPVGPWIVTADELPDPAAIETELRVNGEVRQKASTSDLILDIPGMIEMYSAIMPLHPGDVIGSGTPEGVGPIVAGDRLEIAITNVPDMAMALDVVANGTGYHPVWDKPAA